VRFEEKKKKTAKKREAGGENGSPPVFLPGEKENKQERGPLRR